MPREEAELIFNQIKDFGILSIPSSVARVVDQIPQLSALTRN